MKKKKLIRMKKTRALLNDATQAYFTEDIAYKATYCFWMVDDGVTQECWDSVFHDCGNKFVVEIFFQAVVTKEHSDRMPCHTPSNS